MLRTLAPNQAKTIAAPVQALDVLVFELGGQRFGLPLVDVIEVVRAVEIRTLPEAPRVIEGIIDLRGEIVPVLDVRARFRLPARPLDPSDHFVVASARGRRVVLRAEQSHGLQALDALAIGHALNLPQGAPHVAGVASTSDGLVLIQDLHAFLSDVESAALERALAPAAGEGGAA